MILKCSHGTSGMKTHLQTNCGELEYAETASLCDFSVTSVERIHKGGIAYTRIYFSHEGTVQKASKMVEDFPIHSEHMFCLKKINMVTHH